MRTLFLGVGRVILCFVVLDEGFVLFGVRCGWMKDIFRACLLWAYLH